ncbi:MAG: cyclophilin-like fold protein [Syntrophobacteraceae bacterium]|jgi:hypothetical protein|nr:cyclophilin-like fold protein [Syntrophobacteraceae bacterium]
MGASIRITAGAVNVEGELADSPTGRAIEAALPIRGEARTWGDEIYFPIPVDRDLDETAAEVVEPGDLGYWPTGKAFRIFFGPTPASRGDEIRPASAVSVVGRVLGDARVRKAVEDGGPVKIERAGE